MYWLSFKHDALTAQILLTLNISTIQYHMHVTAVQL